MNETPTTTRRALITTTIRVPHNLRDWRAAGLEDTDTIIVAGDIKSPHEEIKDFLASLPGQNLYLHPDEQDDWECSPEIGWNSIQRRNIALLEAMMLQPDYIITVDDDNYPKSAGHILAWDRHFLGADTACDVLRASIGWWNVGRMLTPNVMMRGFPLEVRHAANIVERMTLKLPIGVTASLWTGDPDCDAIQRIEMNPQVIAQSSRDVALAPGTWCPFNSQATAYLGVLAPLMSVWPHVGRYDDIWSSLAAQRVMQEWDLVVRVGSPMVHQTRNPHNFFNDLKNEMLGLEYTWEFAQKLRGITFPAQCGDITVEDAVNAMSIIVSKLEDEEYIPDSLKAFFRAWLSDCRMATRMMVQE